MSIVATEIDAVMGGNTRRVFYYRCQDHLGTWHPYPPVVTYDAGFDAEAFKTVVAAKVAEQLAEREAREVIG